jgi:hypothetical protein
MIMTTSRTMFRLAGVAALTATLAGCELDVSNPGPIQADELDARGALAGVTNGAGRDLAEALNWVAYTGAAVAREIHPAGSTGAFGITVRQQGGKLVDEEVNTQWNFSQRARWTSEDAVRRIKRVLGSAGSNNATLAQALIWVGYSNRLLGENMCDAVIDGGAMQPSTVYFERAEAAFTEAMTVAQAASNAALVQAATAGRASVRLDRNNLTGAVADAAAITATTFAYRMPYFNTELDQYNRIYWATANQPYRAHTVWNTYYDAYRKATRDPRVPFDSNATQLVGDAAVGNLGRVRWYFETKHNAQTSPINLTTYWEMRLIEAEAKLVNGDIPGAMALLNARRTNLSLPALTAADAAEAWLHLKRERGIELWLEGRRLNDHRRWAALNRPGTLGPLESMAGRDLCFVIGRQEKERNPNLSGG